MRVSDGQLTATSLSYSNFSFSVAGTSYLAQGNLALAYNGSNGGLSGGSGEIALSSNGARVGRLYFGNGSLQIEVNGHVQPFAATAANARR